MVRSYEVDINLEEDRFGFILLCYEDDDCVYDQFFRSSDDAHLMGQRFLDGLSIENVSLEDLE